MGTNLYRKESLEHISSPEQLEGYLQAANPRMWFALVALIVFVAGVIVWGYFGRMEYQAEATASIENGQATLYLDQDDFSEVCVGMPVRIENAEGTLATVSDDAQQLGGASDVPPLAVTDIGIGNWYYLATATIDAPDGTYPASIIFKSASPLSLLFS